MPDSPPPPRAPVGDAGEPAPGTPALTSELESALKLGASIVGLAGFVYVIGGALVWIRFTAAHVPADAMTAVVEQKFLFVVGLKAVVFAAIVFAIISAFAYLIGGALGWKEHGWKQHRTDWHAAVTKGPRKAAVEQAKQAELELADVKAPLGDGPVQAIVGLNFAVFVALVTLSVSKVIEEVFTVTAGIVAPVAVVTALLAGWAASRVNPIGWHGRVQLYLLVIPGLFIAFFAAAPIGVLVLASVGIVLVGPVIARAPRPDSIAAALRSPLPWALLTIYLLVAAAFVAQPPISFTRAIVTTSTGSSVGGYIARTSDGVYLVSCEGLADATSREQHSVLIPAASVKNTSFGGEPFRVDPGERLSLPTVLFGAIGVHAKLPTWFRVDVRTRGSTCGGVAPPRGTRDPALGANVLVGPAPPSGRASGDEATVSETSPAVAALARRFQPTVEVTIADRFWPASVASVLQDRGTLGYALLHRGHRRTCLVKHDVCAASPPTLADLTPLDASPTDYLDYPAALGHGDPTGEFAAFQRGQGLSANTIENWLLEPTGLKPWDSAQVYFFDAGVGTYGSRYGNIPSNLRSLQYWFFYPYNYYPTAVAEQLMENTPLAAIRANTDLHEGDWEHISVLLDPRTLQPRYLYMARHDQEGETYPWSSPKLSFDDGHPIVQAAFGGHPTYPPVCGNQRRAYLNNIVSDWVVCGSGRFGFRADDTPLVDLAHTNWACWPGRFGEATPTQLRNAALPESDPRRYIAKYVLVAGPPSPLRQAENTGTCR